jgi:hypothetical protein
MKSRPDWRAKQQEKNNAKFDEFAKEVSNAEISKTIIIFYRV